MPPHQIRARPAPFAPVGSIVLLGALLWNSVAGIALGQSSVSPENPLSTAYLSGNIERVVYIRDVLNHYNIVPITRGGIVTFVVPGGILEYVMPKTTTVQVEVSDDALYVTGNGTTGGTPLNLRLSDGRITHWMLMATPQGDPQKVIRLVDAPESPKVVAALASGPKTIASPALVSSATPLTPAATAPVVDAPPSLSVERREEPSGLTLTLTNAGTNDLIADSRFLTVMVGGRALSAASFTVPSSALSAGGSVIAQLTGVAPGSRLTVSWLVYNPSANAYLRVSRSL